MTEEEVPILGAMIDELFVLGIMIEMIAAEPEKARTLIEKCVASFNNCRSLAAQLHPDLQGDNDGAKLQ